MTGTLGGSLAILAVPLLPLLAAVVLVLARTGHGGDRRATGRGLRSRWVGGVAMTLSTAAAVATVWWRPEVEVPWIPALGVRLHLGVDGISAPLLLMTSVVATLAVVLPSTSDRPAGGVDPMIGAGRYRACLLLVAAASATALLSRDAVVFVIALQVTLVPLWWLVQRYGSPAEDADRGGAATRFLLTSVVGTGLTLLGVLALVVTRGTADLDVLAQGVSGVDDAQTAVAAVLLLGLAVSVPVWPLHSWLPWVHATAPTAATILLASVLMPLGGYGMIRLVVGPLPDGLSALAPLLAAAAVVGIVWAGLTCVVERDLGRLIAWAAVATMGMVVLAIAAGGETGLQAALLGLTAHGVVAALLAVVVGALVDRWGSADLRAPRAAVRETAPRLGWGLTLGVAALVGVPGLAVFWADLSALLAAWDPTDGRTAGWFRFFAVLALVGAVLLAAFGVRVLREVWAGDRVEPRISDAGRVEAAAIVLLGLALLVLGVLPSLVLDLSAVDVARLLGGAP